MSLGLFRRRRNTPEPAPRADFMADPARAISLTEPISQACTSSQFGEAAYAHWCGVLGEAPYKHRKQWEYCYILQALARAGMLAPGRRGVGFGVGAEPLASVIAAMGATVLATDMDQEAARTIGWTDTNQHAASLDALNAKGLCDAAAFRSRVSFQTVDMNKIGGLVEGYDFTWSACSLEHLGSIRHGLDFIENSLDLLRPGGVAAHTTELNCSSNDDTIEYENLVLFRRRDFEALGRSLAAKGHRLTMSFDLGHEELDAYVDLPPYRADPHIKLQVLGYTTTSFGILVEKGDEGSGPAPIRPQAPRS